MFISNSRRQRATSASLPRRRPAANRPQKQSVRFEAEQHCRRGLATFVRVSQLCATRTARHGNLHVSHHQGEQYVAHGGPRPYRRHKRRTVVRCLGHCSLFFGGPGWHPRRANRVLFLLVRCAVCGEHFVGRLRSVNLIWAPATTGESAAIKFSNFCRRGFGAWLSRSVGSLQEGRRVDHWIFGAPSRNTIPCSKNHFFWHPPVAIGPAKQGDCRRACSKNARIRASWGKFQKSPNRS